MLDYVSHSGWPNLKRVPTHRMGIYFQDNYMNEDLPPTQSLVKWLGPAQGHFFRGPFLAHGYENGEKFDDGYESEDCKSFDLDTSALRVLLEFFYAQGALYHGRKAFGGGPVHPNIVRMFAN